MDEEVGKVAPHENGKEFTKSYSNALSSELPKEIGNDSESIDHIPGEERGSARKKGHDGGRRRTDTFRGTGQCPKNIIHYL